MAAEREGDYDVAIVGGGPAGLQAALVLGRMRRRVIVFDTGDPANAVEHAVSGLLTRDGTPPEELRAVAREQLGEYPTVELSQVGVAGARREADGFAVELADGGEVRAAKLLLAHGLDYGLPDVPGLDELWGDKVFHCPYCHGWEVRDRHVVVLATAARAVNQALLLRSLADRITVLSGDDSTLDEKGQRRLQAAGVEVVAGGVERVERTGDGVRVTVAGEGSVECDAVFVQTELRLRSDIAESLGARLGDEGMIEVDASGGTGVAGLRAAGDAALPPQSAAHAIGSGAVAAYALNAELALEPFESEPTLSDADPV